MAQTLKSKISQMANAYSIGAIIETAKQVQKENSTQLNIIDHEVGSKILGLADQIRDVSKELKFEAEQNNPDLQRVVRLSATAIHHTRVALDAILDRVTIAREWEKK
jgi:hypothetical protein